MQYLFNKLISLKSFVKLVNLDPVTVEELSTLVNTIWAADGSKVNESLYNLNIQTRLPDSILVDDAAPEKFVNNSRISHNVSGMGANIIVT